MAVVHPEAADTSAVAKALLEAAEKLGLDPFTAVASTTDGAHGIGFVVSDEVAALFGKFMEQSQPILVTDMVSDVVPLIVEVPAEVPAELDEPPVLVAEPEPDKPKRGPGRPRKATPAPESETEE